MQGDADFVPEEEDRLPEPVIGAIEDNSEAPKAKSLEPARNRKVYKLADSAVAILGGRLAKRKAEALAAAAQEGAMEYDGHGNRRSNAILIHGPPIRHLSTDKVFAYSGHYATAAEQIEWIDDQSCVLVYPSSSTAMAAFSTLRKVREPSNAVEAAIEGDEEMILCQPVPALLWPMEERLAKSLGKSQGLTGQIMMRWALRTDLKQRGSRNKSEYYKKHGDTDDTNPWERSNKRRREDDDSANDRVMRERERAALDAELDTFALREENDFGVAASPKERDSVGSLMNRLGPPLDGRKVAPLPRQRRWGAGSSRHTGPGYDQRRAPDKESLDAELDAFLREREGD